MSTKSALQSLEMAFKLIRKTERRDDEFTLNEFVAHHNSKGVFITRSSASHQLKRMVQLNMMTERKVLISGFNQLVYSLIS